MGDIDIRTDVPQYRIWKKGELIDEPLDIKKYWNDDLVAFVLGCSMSFELPLIEAGIKMQHIENDTIVPMYQTSIDCEKAGQFSGKMVVTQRLLKTRDGAGRVGAFEIMKCTAPIQNLIREAKIHKIPSIMQTAVRDGMITMDKSLEELAKAGKIDPGAARSEH